MKKVLLILFLLNGMFFYSGCTPRTEPAVTENFKEITVCAAASLREALNELQPQFEQEKHIKLVFSFAASGALQKQIEEGAPADVFLSAGKKQMDTLEDKGLIDKDSRRDLLSNRLVLIVSAEAAGKIKDVSDLADLDIKIGMGQPETVPAGQYAKEALTFLKLWDKLESKIVYAKDVKQAAAYVESGEAAAGVVYRSDAVGLKSSVIAQAFDEASHKLIVYPVAIVSASKQKEASKVFWDFLHSEASKKVFEKYGFDIITK